MKNKWVAILLMSLLISGCNLQSSSDLVWDNGSQFGLPKEKMSELSYGILAQKVFLPKCVSCHGHAGGVNLESYSEILKNLDQIKKTVFTDKTMPKRGYLTDEEMAYLWNWLEMGAPEDGQAPTTPPTEEPIMATFDSLNKHIFQASCKECHNPADSGKRVPLDKESLLNSPLELVLPGNPDESGLVLAVERMDQKRMPPAKAGYSALSAEAKSAIRKWIQNGARD